jgi:hypothetical protein
MIDYFITVSVIVRRDDVCGTMMKENDGDRWNSNDVVL